MGKKGKKLKTNHILRQKKIWVENIRLLPFVIAASIVPLIVYLRVVPVPDKYKLYWHTQYDFDFFSFYKSKWILFAAIIIVAILVLLYFYDRLEIKKNIIFIPIVVFASFIILSSLLSSMRDIAFQGYYDRFEGMWVLLAYLVIAVGAYLLINNENDIKFVLITIAVSSVIIGLIGIFQYIGVDFFVTEFGRKLILPGEYHSLASKINPRFGKYTIYSTLNNPNYVGSYMAMLLPMLLVFFIMVKKKRLKLIIAGLSLLSLATLIGSNSRAGMVGATIAIIITVLLLRKYFVKNWKAVTLIAVIFFLFFICVEVYSGGIIGNRLSLLKKDITKIITSNAPTDEKVNQKLEQLVNKLGVKASWADRAIVKYGAIGSGRGYIWIRTIEMMEDTLILGKGPDTFAFYFPLKDPVKFLCGFKQIVDKPHNMYMQIGVNIGGIALLAFLIMIIIYFVQSVKVLWNTKLEHQSSVIALGLFTACIGYLVAGFFNDSVVSVAPVFWTIFGLSLASNEIVKQDGTKMRE